MNPDRYYLVGSRVYKELAVAGVTAEYDRPFPAFYHNGPLRSTLRFDELSINRQPYSIF
jgi:hypothetical protein